MKSWSFDHKLTLLGQSTLLLFFELGSNLLLWLILLISLSNKLWSLGLIAWTLGLRHGLDMDHIIAIDNVTRNLVTLGQLPITCGLFFSLGHSTIVVGVTIAIIISTSLIDKLSSLGAVGSVVGVSISASFLTILAIINSYFLHQALKRRRSLRQLALTNELEEKDKNDVTHEGGGIAEEKEAKPRDVLMSTCMLRLTRPLFKMIDRPWKMYPVGVLFGFGFDTASEIALLGISALARTTSDDSSPVPTSQILILPLLFTSGMTLVDSCDSIFMLYAYTQREPSLEVEENIKWWRKVKFFEKKDQVIEVEDKKRETNGTGLAEQKLLGVSIVLAIISISVALLIAIIEFMGLAAQECNSCAEAADSEEGLAGNWWRFWIDVNNNSGYIGAVVVFIFVSVLSGWRIKCWISKKRKASSSLS